MNVVLNGKTVSLTEGITVKGLVDQKSLDPETIIIEYNFIPLKREQWDGTALKEGDRVEILRFVGGG
ncbi:MAG: sulfur carrier protein ThiS [Bacillota bacterium]